MNLQSFYEWYHWETIMHSLLFTLILYSIYMFYTKKQERTLTNILLFTLIVGMDTLIHQNSNLNKKTI